MKRNYRLFAAATATGLIGFLAVSPSAQAYPFASGCDKYAFNGEFRARGNNWTVTFNSNGEYASGPAVVRFDDGGQVSGHVVSGRILGTAIDFNILWHDKPNNNWYFRGDVRDGNAQGSQSTQFRGQGTNWLGQTPLACATPPPAPSGPVPGLR
ncbi:hypothetical protein ABGB19_06875 [Mycobacterium sp. B14F4]|uniref:hypothetical protein n=1 Tax=Mycobacterium sp. B14F4 TaxID=3153565 RepID=UPI00325E5A4B